MTEPLRYLWMGFTHVLPLGIDHILFMVNLCFLHPRLRMVVLYCSFFTLAHSVTLGLASMGLLQIHAALVEPVISFSVLLTAVANISGTKAGKGLKLPLIVLFGLFHGMGFASALDAAGLSGRKFFLGLLFFNGGVELAQVLVVATAYFLLVRPFSARPWYRERVVKPVSMIIACVAMYWTMVRLFP